jgi:lysozyme
VDQGDTSNDPTIAQRIADPRYAGHLGLYHFASGSDPTEQAQHFITRAQAIGFDKNKHAVVLDYEHSALPDAVGVDMKVAQAQTWIGLVEAALGCKVIVYGSDMLTEALQAGAFVSQPLWPARYRVAPPELPNGRRWTFWQNQGEETRGTPYGDMDKFNGTQAELDATWPFFSR